MANPEKISEDVAKLTLDVELVKRDVLQFNKILEKLDTTNNKVQELITNISKIVSLHEQKFSVIEKEQANTSDEMLDFNIRLKSLEKFKWNISGGLTIISLIVGYIISILFS
jgi:predicted  nucleic acid-binding Zn-ribbon protein